MKFAIGWGLALAIGYTAYAIPAEASGRLDAPQPDCPGAETTIDMNRCYATLLHRAEAKRERYLATAVSAQADRPQVQAAMRKAGKAFLAYRDAECGAVYEDWKEGTIRDVMTLGCEIDLTDRRTHTIWAHWLTYMDSTPPRLPEPEPTR
ncbi:MAG: lysozyme inhibitor LprI family protein [Sphingomonadaceae bacterium]